jgi:hypothetical protein
VSALRVFRNPPDDPSLIPPSANWDEKGGSVRREIQPQCETLIVRAGGAPRVAGTRLIGGSGRRRFGGMMCP